MDDKEKQIAELRTATLNLINAVLENGESVKQLIAEVKEIRDAQRKSDERLDKVIEMFEKFLENGNNDSNNK